MKFNFFLIVSFLIGALLFELLCQKIFNISAIELLKWCKDHGSSRLPVIFMAGIGVPVFFIFLAYRFYNMYVATTIKPDCYVFLGDKLKEGFYAYKKDDKLKTRIFIPSFLDMNVYPASSLNSLYHQKLMFKGKDGNYTKFDFFNIGNLILQSLFHLATFMFAFLGILALFKNYAVYNSLFMESGQDLKAEGIETIFKSINLQTNNLLTHSIFVVTAFYVFSVVYIKVVTRKIKNQKEVEETLPKQIKDGASIEGVIVAEESYSEKFGHSDSQSSTKFYKQYAVEFRKEFNPPVIINFSINKKNNERTIKRFDEAFRTGESQHFILNENLCIDIDKL